MDYVNIVVAILVFYIMSAMFSHFELSGVLRYMWVLAGFILSLIVNKAVRFLFGRL